MAQLYCKLMQKLTWLGSREAESYSFSNDVLSIWSDHHVTDTRRLTNEAGADLIVSNNGSDLFVAEAGLSNPPLGHTPLPLPEPESSGDPNAGLTVRLDADLLNLGAPMRFLTPVGDLKADSCTNMVDTGAAGAHPEDGVSTLFSDYSSAPAANFAGSFMPGPAQLHHKSGDMLAARFHPLYRAEHGPEPGPCRLFCSRMIV